MAALAHHPVHANAADHEGDHGFRKIKEYLPWIKYPLIVNAPMGEFTSPELIASVLKAGGHGQHGTINIPDRLPHDLEAIKKVIDADPVLKGYSDKIDGRLPISLGFLLVYGNMDALKETVAKYRPAVIWLFAGRTIKDYKDWATTMRAASPGTKIWVQAGSIATITRLAHNVQPDVIVVQGSDAGGHGLENGAGIVSILPEAADTLAAQGHGNIPLLASGGIVEGRGVAACIALGAAGVVMGTRFLASPEAVVHPILANRIIAATDGGQSTVRTKVFDDLMGGSWPGEYDSRGLRIQATESSTGAANDVDISEITDMHKEIARKPGGGYSADNAICWAGCSVGLVNRHQSAFDIANEVREQAIRVLKTGVGKCETEPN